MGPILLFAASLMAFGLMLWAVAEGGRCPKGGEHMPELRADGSFCRKCGAETL